MNVVVDDLLKKNYILVLKDGCELWQSYSDCTVIMPWKD